MTTTCPRCQIGAMNRSKKDKAYICDHCGLIVCDDGSLRDSNGPVTDFVIDDARLDLYYDYGPKSGICRACDNPDYPKCMSSCKYFDD